LLQRLARTMYRRRRSVVAGWIALLIGVSALSATAGGEFLDEFSLPGSESQEAFDLLAQEDEFQNRSGETGQVVFRADQGVDDPGVQQAMEDLFADLEASVSGADVVSPYAPEGARQVSPLDPTIAYAEINLADRDANAYAEARQTAHDLVGQVELSGLQVELGGSVFQTESEFSTEGVGFLAAMVILLLAFGSLLAMGLPLVTALFGIGTGIALVGLAVNFIDMPSFSSQAVLMIGIGVGIDYALFIVTRYREELHGGLEPAAAVVRAIDTAGRAVLFAGTTVVIAVLGLFLSGMAMIVGVATGIALGVLMTMLASVTLLPAILGFTGRNIDRLGLPYRRRRDSADRRSLAYRWSHLIQRRAWVALLLGSAVLVALAWPALDMRMGFGDSGNAPTTDTTRRAYDLLAQGFGPGVNGPLLLVAETPGGTADLGVLETLASRLEATPGVQAVSPPIPNSLGDVAIVQVQPTTAPQDEETEELTRHLREDLVPAVTDGTGVTVRVSGVTAAVIDFAEHTAERLPLIVAAVLVLSFLLLMLVFRSVVVPLKAVGLNLLSIGAAYGVLVAVFQWGWGMEWLGIGKEGPVEAWVPMMMFAVLFGLSMDYEVFLLSRIREDYLRTGDTSEAVATGLTSTARVITAAAAIMVVIFGGFALSDDRDLKLMGFGLAVAILLDASLVRMVLVPSAMRLLGPANWWLPRWLDRVLPAVSVEPVPDDEVSEERDRSRSRTPTRG
jgi:RND superfamily putative drug exporter